MIHVEHLMICESCNKEYSSFECSTFATTRQTDMGTVYTIHSLCPKCKAIDKEIDLGVKEYRDKLNG